MAVNEFVLTNSFVQIASVESILTATTVSSGRVGNIEIADTMGGAVPYARVMRPSEQVWLNCNKDYFARTLDPEGMTIRVEDCV